LCYCFNKSLSRKRNQVLWKIYQLFVTLLFSECWFESTPVSDDKVTNVINGTGHISTNHDDVCSTLQNSVDQCHRGSSLSGTFGAFRSRLSHASHLRLLARRCRALPQRILLWWFVNFFSLFEINFSNFLTKGGNMLPLYASSFLMKIAPECVHNT